MIHIGNVRRVMAVHEAGHAVANLLLGHHVIAVGLDVHDNADELSVYGDTTFMSLNSGVLADLVITAAGEAAARHLLEQDGCPDAAAYARGTAEHDALETQRLAAGTTLPVQIGGLLAAPLVADHWPAIQCLAQALHDAPGHRLDAADVLDAAALGNVEVTWEQLGAQARQVMPGDPGVQAFLVGPGQRREDDRAALLAELQAYGLLSAPEGALRRQVLAEIYRRGSAELDAELTAARAGVAAGQIGGA